VDRRNPFLASIRWWSSRTVGDDRRTEGPRKRYFFDASSENIRCLSALTAHWFPDRRRPGDPGSDKRARQKIRLAPASRTKIDPAIPAQCKNDERYDHGPSEPEWSRAAQFKRYPGRAPMEVDAGVPANEDEQKKGERRNEHDFHVDLLQTRSGQPEMSLARLQFCVALRADPPRSVARVAKNEVSVFRG
jgi:hypothetical protein